jgi:hypothetical protein
VRAAMEAGQNARQARAIAGTRNSTHKGSSMNVLLVENDEAVRTCLIEMLREVGLHVAAASTATEALALSNEGAVLVNRRRDCQEFRVRGGMMGWKEPLYASTQRSSHSGRPLGPAPRRG